MDLKIFQTPNMGKQVRTVVMGDVVWFVAKDVAEVLEYPESSIKQMANLLKSVPDEWKGHIRIMTPGGEQEVTGITDKGLYFFLGRSDKRLAASFQKWIAGEVVPSIIATGSYAIPVPVQAAPAVPLTYRDAVAALLDTLDAKAAVEGQLEAARPAIEFHERVAQAQGEFGITEAAMEIGVKVPDFVQGLLDRGYVKRTGKHGPEKKGKLEPTHYSIKMGYMAIRMTVVRGVAYPEAVFLPRGIQWAVKLFKRAA